MDQLSVVFLISVFALSCLGSVMVAVADAAAFPHILTIPMAIAALVFTEFRRSFRLSTAWSNLLGTIALGYAIVRMFPLFVHLLQGRGLPEQGVAREIIVAAHLLAFLSWIVFFMPKRPREYWAMCTLSVLQVAIGAILTSSGIYGMLLACYVLLGIWTLSIFSIEQTRWQVAENEQSTDWLRFGAPDKVQSKSPVAARPRAMQAATSLEGYWKRPSRSQSTIQIDAHERWISPRFILGMLATAAVSVLVSGLFVVFTPRVWAGRGPLFTGMGDPDGAALTGFTESVKLGGESRIKESNDLVMEVRLFNNDTGENIDVEEYSRKQGYKEPLFFGSYLETYEKSAWTTKLSDGHKYATVSRRPERLIREEIRLQPTGSGVLLAMAPVAAAVIDDREYAVYNNMAGTLMRFRQPESDLGRIFSAGGATQEIVGIPWTKPLELTAFTREDVRWKLLRGIEDDVYRQFPPRGLEKLRTLAKELADKAKQEGASNEEEVAVALEKYFLNSREFIYTLELERRDFNLDPLEDFLFNTKAGHCEYYASALAMMLRAADIPSRLISGFKGGNLNKYSGYFDVRQLHAHAWVQAYVAGRWITLDPTPAREIRQYSGGETSLLNWQAFRTFVEGLWTAYVTNADITKQRTHIYEPLSKKVRTWWSSMSGGGQRLTEVTYDLWQTLRSPRNWFSWQGGLIAAIICAVLAVLVWGLKGSIARLRRLWQYLFHNRSQKHSAIAFYERFRRICRARGLEREPAQTQREFVARVHQSLNDLLASVGLTTFPRHLVDGFYQVRFGGIPLDEQTAAEIDQKLTLLEQSLKQEKRR